MYVKKKKRGLNSVNTRQKFIYFKSLQIFNLFQVQNCYDLKSYKIEYNMIMYIIHNMI